MIIHGQVFDTIEQYFQYKRAIHYDQPETARIILQNSDPVMAGKLGSRIPKVHPGRNRSRRIVKTALQAKFNQNKHLKRSLLETGDRDLIAADPRDSYWGAGTTTKNMNMNLASVTGHNRLGKIMSEVRSILNND